MGGSAREMTRNCFEYTRPGKRYQKAMENHHLIAGEINYFDWVSFNSYVKLPEGMGWTRNYQRVSLSWVIVICHMFSVPSHHLPEIPRWTPEVFFGVNICGEVI
jgi:hypothetical protein